MDSLFHPVAEFISRHHEWAGVVLGLATLLESLVLIGAFVPATALMLLAGSLIATGVLDPLPVIVGCSIGAIIGNGVSFALGRRLGPRAFRHPILARHPRLVARTRLLCRKYGTASIYLGRFFGPLRAFVPIVVGMLRMRRRTFQVANIASAPIWVLAMLAPGYFTVKGLAKIELLSEADIFTLLIVAACGAIALAFATWRILRAVAARRALGQAAARAATTG